MAELKNKIEVGSIVIRAYAWHCDEWGVVVAAAVWDARGESSEEDYIENFTVMWPGGNLTLEMDVELLAKEDHEELVRESNENR